MKIAWLPALIFCATLAMVGAGLDLGPIIKIAQCQSTCLREHATINGNCWERNEIGIIITECYKCWDTCQDLHFMKKKELFDNCMLCKFIYPNCQGCKTACTFYQTRGMEEEKYEPTKLPAPEENNAIQINNFDVAIVMQRNWEGIWQVQNYYYVKDKLEIKPGNWIIVVTDDGVVKHYCWENWRPKLQSLKAGGPLYQAYITWQDWRTQLKNQRPKVSNYFKNILQRQIIKEEQYKPSFVITWQQETGDSIMGNQVTDSESAQISLSCGKYLVRVATDNGPGSYPIVVDTGVCTGIPKTSIWEYFKSHYIYNQKGVAILITLVIFLGMILFYFLHSIKRYIREKDIIEDRKEIWMEKYLKEAEKELMKERNLMKKNQDAMRLYPHATVYPLWTEEADTNVNSSVKAQNVNANTTQKS